MKKLTCEFVREQFEKEGYTLLDDEYINNKVKLEYMCPLGHEHYISWGKWQSGRRCPHCYGHGIGSNITLTGNYVSEEFRKCGYILLSEYEHSHKKLKYKCLNGHINYITWANFKHNNGSCSLCSYEKLSVERSGENNPQWRGGISKLPYCPNWTKEYKEEIKDRDNYQCLNPYCFGTDSRLVIHHINYTKTLCGPDNLITLCGSCNSRANKDREWHTQWYRTILNRRYGYEY